ncbi:MAG: nucleotidyl transferase AbiEii/AbiGii toxin family protein [Gammaproteobacteria bacterium]
MSKAHDLIQRFSEDLDFRCLYTNTMSGNQQKKARSKLREQIVESVQQLDELEINTEQMQVASNYIKFPLLYKSLFDQHQALRPHLEIEFSFTQPQLEPTIKNITSFVNRLLGEESETSIPCLPPIEIAADKLSALCWRVLKRDRSNEDDDPTLVRHLHDLCALNNEIAGDIERFYLLFKASHDTDQGSTARQTGMQALEAVGNIVEKLKSDCLYKKEYEQFVESMSYATDDEQIGFSLAIEKLSQLYGRLKAIS